MSNPGTILWIALVVSLFTAVYAIRMAFSWRDWRLTIPVLGILTVTTGPVLEIARHAGLIDPEFAHTIVDYRWLVVSVVALLAVIVMERVVDRERRLRRRRSLGRATLSIDLAGAAGRGIPGRRRRALQLRERRVAVDGRHRAR